MTAKLLIGLLMSGFLLAGCSQAPDEPDVDITHAHGIAYVNDRLYIATHHGLVMGAPAGKSWGWMYASEERFDLMGFTVDDRGTFYSSGHPSDPRAFGGTNLGLRQSTDGGHLWEQRSLKGQTDFHALTALPGSGNLAAYWRNAIMESTDGGVTWTNTTGPATSNVLALAASPGALWAGGLDGLYKRSDGNWTKQNLVGAVVSVAVARDGQTLWVSQMTQTSGATWTSSNGGVTWAKAAGHKIMENVQAPILFAIDSADAKHVFASDASGFVIETRDGGTSWSTLRE
ncbi:MAG: hypothetical protein WC876_03685 [Candidatus Thermoplasmatota archaeon]|jgi:photosystem II stability/assembly factor-like uncharacterized protein